MRKAKADSVLLLVLMVFAWLAPMLSLPGAEDRVQRLREAQETGRQLVREGRYEDALLAAGRWSNVLRREVLSAVEQANRQGDRAKAIALYAAYFRYYPFGYLYWHQDSSEWDGAAMDYVRLRRTRQDPADKELADDVAAMELYRPLVEHHRKYDLANCSRLADEIIAKYPRSLFAPAAALSVAHVTEQRNCSGAAGIPVYEKYLAKLQEADASKRSQILLLLPQAHGCTNYGNKPGELRKGLAVYQIIREMTEIAYEKRFCLLESAKTAVKIGDQEALELGRKLFQQFLNEYPSAIEAEEARKGIVQSYLKTGQTAEAERALRDLEKTVSAPGESAEQLFAVSQAHFKAAEYAKALKYLQEIVERFPQSGVRPLAYLGMGEVYEKTGEEEKMLAAYAKAAESPRSPTATNIMDASDSHNRANERLARHYMAKQAWAEALRWWTQWKPSSWCGTCADSMEARRAYNIAVCLLHLGRSSEAAKTCLDFLFTRQGWDPEIALLVARLYEDAEQAGDLQKMVDAFEEGKLREFDGKGYFAKQTREEKLKYLPTRPIRERARIAQLAKEGDVERLAAICKATHSSSRNIFEDAGDDWPCKEAAEALAGLGDRGVEAAESLLFASAYWGSWPIHVLGRSSSPKALEVLRRLAKKENSYNSENVAYAIALHGEAGKKLLAEVAADRKNFVMARAAEQWLKKPQSGLIASTPTWPRLKPGTLPRSP